MWQAMNHRLIDHVDGLEIECANLGFDGDIQIPRGHFDLVVGHSMGVLWLLDNPELTFDRLVAINGFTKFCETPDMPSGCPQAVVDQMCERLLSDQSQLLKDFYDNAGVTGNTSQFGLNSTAVDTAQLDSALADLIRVDGREQWTNFDGPRSVIAATGDRIVRKEHTQTCFPDEDIRWVESDCHCLPAKFPDVCAEVIRELIEVR